MGPRSSLSPRRCPSAELKVSEPPSSLALARSRICRELSLLEADAYALFSHAFVAVIFAPYLVTSYRSTTDVLDHLSLPTSPAPSSAFFPSSVSASNNPAPSSSSSPHDVPLVVFLPLNDLSSALVYAANLLRDARQTPTASCFQPDSVSPAEKIELAVSLSLDGIRAISRDKHARERGVVVVGQCSDTSLDHLLLASSCSSLDRVCRAGGDG